MPAQGDAWRAEGLLPQARGPGHGQEQAGGLGLGSASSRRPLLLPCRETGRCSPAEDGVCTDDDNNRRRNREQEEEKRVLARAQLGALIDLPLSNLSWVRIVCMR